jgi:uncharacterized protein YmfQ (DUF2313 family)
VLFMLETFVAIFRLLLPLGRAWNIRLSNAFQALIRGIMGVAVRLRLYFILIRDDVFPDTTRALTLWEEQFALRPVDGMTEDERRERLAGRWAAQGGQSPTYIEDVLLALGIVAKVYENFNTYPVTCGDGTTCGDGSTCIDPEGNFDSVILVNGFIPGKTYEVSDDQEKWVFYFFIADPSDINVPVIIPIALKSAFITTLLQIKPTHTRAVLNVLYE